MGLVKILDECVNTIKDKYEIDPEYEIEKILSKAKENAAFLEKRFNNYIFEQFENCRVNQSDEYVLNTVGHYIDAKNTLVRHSKKALSGLYYENFKSPNFSKYICFYILDHYGKESFKEIENELISDLSEIVFTHNIILHHKMITGYDGNYFHKREITSEEFYEVDYINQLQSKLDILERERFDRDFIFKDYIFNLDVVSISIIFQLIRELGIIDSKITLGEFCLQLKENNTEKIIFDLKGTPLTNPQLGYFFYNLKKYYKGKDVSYKNYLLWNFKISTKQGRDLYLNDKAYKKLVRPYNFMDESSPKIISLIDTYFNRISKIEANI